MGFATFSVPFLIEFATTVLFFPFREITNSLFGPSHSFPRDTWRGVFYAERWAGMFLNPLQPAVIALPCASLVTSYLLVGGGVSGIVVGGTFHGIFGSALSTLSRRLDSIHHYNGPFDCIVKSTKERGVAAWFHGAAARAAISSLWYGIVLHRSLGARRKDYLEDMFDTWRSFAWMTFLTSPLQTMFRASLFRTEQQRGFSRSFFSYCRGEAAIFDEAVRTARTMMAQRGPRFFFEGTLHTIFKKGLPFAISVAWMKVHFEYFNVRPRRKRKY